MKTFRFLLKFSLLIAVCVPSGLAIGRALVRVQEQEGGKAREDVRQGDLFNINFRPTFAAFDAPALPDCSQSHCSSIDAIIYQICRANHWDASVKVPTREPDGSPQGKPCFCSCSCLAYDTKVAIPEGMMSIQEFEAGDPILVLDRGDDKGRWVPAKVRTASGTSVEPTSVNYAIRVKVGGKILISNADHLYLMADGSLKRADRLNVGDELMSSKFEPVAVASVINGSYQGGFYNVVTDAPEDAVDGHLISTDGVISADYLLQSSQGPNAELLDEPQVGSPGYIAANPNFMEAAERIEPESEADAGFFPAGNDPAPNNARSFLPRDAERADPRLDFRAMDDSLSQLKAKQLLNLWFGYYNDITFQLDWNSNTVNARAWIDQSTGRRNVIVYGGLARHPSIGWEGLSLVIAHEVGHHFGGSPYYPNIPGPLSCEGQADYWAALIAMRNVYPEEEYFEVIVPAIDQLHRLFSVGLVEDQNSDEAAAEFADNPCGHPPADCRRDTYNAAVNLQPKPSCAGPSADALSDRGKGADEGAGDAPGLVVKFTRSGGFAGRRVSGEFSASELSPGSARRLREAVEASDVFDAEIEPGGPEGADEFEYTVTIRQGGRSRTVELFEATAPPALRPILELIEQRIAVGTNPTE